MKKQRIKDLEDKVGRLERRLDRVEWEPYHLLPMPYPVPYYPTRCQFTPTITSDPLPQCTTIWCENTSFGQSSDNLLRGSTTVALTE